MSVVERIPASCAAQRDIRHVPIADRSCLPSLLASESLGTGIRLLRDHCNQLESILRVYILGTPPGSSE